MTKARLIDKARIWAALTGHFNANDILQFSAFQKSILTVLRTTNPEFNIGKLFTKFKGFNCTVKWLDTSESPPLEKTDLIAFQDLIAIRSFRKELKNCTALWKFLYYGKKDLFWSMVIYYTMIKTTGLCPFLCSISLSFTVLCMFDRCGGMGWLFSVG